MRGLALVLTLSLLSGCSTYDLAALREGVEFKALAPWKGKAAGYRILIAPIVEDRVAADGEDTLRGRMRLDTAELQRELERALGEVVGSGPKPQVAIANSVGDPAIQAFQQGFDLVLEAKIKRWDAVFLGTNGWWYPNALFLAWYFWPIGPHWVIADEVYGVDCELILDLRSAASERSLSLRDVHRRVVLRSSEPGSDEPLRPHEPLAAPWLALDDLDRGLDLFGTWISGDLDPDQWEQVGGLLQPYARRHAAVRVAAAVADAVAQFEALSVAEKEQMLAATHALVVGISGYARECPAADKDADAFYRLLTGDLPRLPPEADGDSPLPDPEGLDAEAIRRERRWAPEKNVIKLINAQATSTAIESSLKTLADRTQPQDRLVVFFAGRGERKPGVAGLEGLVLHPFGGGPPISLASLAKVVSGAKARRRLIVLDVDFHGGDRGDGKWRRRRPLGDLATLMREGFLPGDSNGAVILATSLEGGEETQAYEDLGLLSQYLVKGLRGAADEGDDGLSYADLETYLTRHVVNLSEVALEHPQRPVVVSTSLGDLIR